MAGKEVNFSQSDFIAAATGKKIPPVPEKKDEKPQDPAPAQQTLDDYWAEIEEQGIEVPAHIREGKDEQGNPLNRKQKIEALRQILLETTQFGNTEDDDEFVRDYMIASTQQGFDRSKWLESKMETHNFMKLPNREFLKKVYKMQSEQNNYGWSDEDIDAKLNSMTKIDVDTQADQVRAGLMKSRQPSPEQLKAQEEQHKQLIEKRIKETNEKISVNLKKYIAENRAKKNMGGFEFNEAEANEYFESLPAFLERKEVKLPDGRIMIASKADLVLADLLSSQDKGMQIMPFLYLISTGKLDGFFSSKVEEKKEKIEQSLQESPEEINKGLPGQPGFNADSFKKAAQNKG